MIIQTKKRLGARGLAALATSFALAVGSYINADIVPPGFNVIVEGNGSMWQLINNPDDFTWIPDPDGGGFVEQVQTSVGEGWEGGFSGTGFLLGSTSVFGNFALTNTSPSTQTFIVTVVSPLLQTLPGQTQIRGSIGGSIVDTGGGGATVAAPAGGSIYTAMVDGNDVRTLMDGFSYSVPDGDADSLPPESFPFEPGPFGAFIDIGIRHEFTLTAGDSVTFSSAFHIIPAPATVAVLALGGLVGRRRRRD